MKKMDRKKHLAYRKLVKKIEGYIAEEYSDVKSFVEHDAINFATEREIEALDAKAKEVLYHIHLLKRQFKDTIKKYAKKLKKEGV